MTYVLMIICNNCPEIQASGDAVLFTGQRWLFGAKIQRRVRKRLAVGKEGIYLEEGVWVLCMMGKE